MYKSRKKYTSKGVSFASFHYFAKRNSERQTKVRQIQHTAYQQGVLAILCKVCLITDDMCDLPHQANPFSPMLFSSLPKGSKKEEEIIVSPVS